MECAAEGGGGTRRGSGATQAFWTAHTPSPHEASGVRGTETYQTGPCQCKQTRAKTPSATAATTACPQSASRAACRSFRAKSERPRRWHVRERYTMTDAPDPAKVLTGQASVAVGLRAWGLPV